MTGRFIGALLSPKPTTSISLPAHLLSLGSNVAMWLTPPHMNRKITLLARGVKWGPMAPPGVAVISAAGMSPAFAHIAPSATPRNPPPAWWRKLRRERRPQGYSVFG